MITIFRASAASAMLAAALLSACSPAAPPNLAANAAPGPTVFTLNTPVDRIAADPQGKAVLNRDIPGLMANKDYPLFDDMSLSQIAMVSGGRLTKSKLDLVQSDLTQRAYPTPAPVIQPAQ